MKKLIELLSITCLVLLGACSGSGTLTITPEPTIVTTAEVGLCADATDNDDDGTTDCSDTDCQGDAACEPTSSEAGACTDGTDNDGDSATDCADSDCSSDATACPPSGTTESDCTNTTDDDGDGNADCADADCATNAACPQTVAEICDNQIDDNSDTLTDCNDAACTALPECADVDGDGHFAGADCDDNNPSVNASGREIYANNIDENCDGFDFNPENPKIKWVRSEGGEDLPTCGALDKPCHTVEFTVKNIAKHGDDKIALFEGVYVLDHPVKLTKKIGIYGGFYDNNGEILSDPINHKSEVHTNGHLFGIRGMNRDDRVIVDGISFVTKGTIREFMIVDANPIIHNIDLTTERVENGAVGIVILATNAGHKTAPVIRGSRIKIGEVFRTTPGPIVSLPIVAFNTSANNDLNLFMHGNIINTGNLQASANSLAVGLFAGNPGVASHLNIRLEDNSFRITESDLGAAVIANRVTHSVINRNKFTLYAKTPIQGGVSITGRNIPTQENVILSNNRFRMSSDPAGAALITIGVASQNIHTNLHNNTFVQDKAVIANSFNHFSGAGVRSKLHVVNNIMTHNPGSLIARNVVIAGVMGTDYKYERFSKNDFFGAVTPVSYWDGTTLFTDIAVLEAALNATASVANGNLSVDPLMTIETIGEEERLALDPASPMIDAGRNPVRDVVSERDLHGGRRVIDGNGDGNKVIDIGAVEYKPAP